MFEQALLAGPQNRPRGYTFAASLTAQMLVTSALILIPLYLVEQPPVSRFHATLMAPSPPPAPPLRKMAPASSRVAPRVFESGRLLAPRAIPNKVADIVEESLPSEFLSGVGVPGGLPDLIIGSLVNQASRLAPPPAPPPTVNKDVVEKPRQRIRVGGDVLEAKLIHRVMPVYPPLAKQARISGTVKLVGVINREGRIISLQVISGHPLLVAAAVDAVRQWIYRPTLLNKEPVEVIAPIDVNFVIA